MPRSIEPTSLKQYSLPKLVLAVGGVSRQVARVLLHEGTFWLNRGDKYQAFDVSGDGPFLPDFPGLDRIIAREIGALASARAAGQYGGDVMQQQTLF